MCVCVCVCVCVCFLVFSSCFLWGGVERGGEGVHEMVLVGYKPIFNTLVMNGGEIHEGHGFH